MKFKKYLDTVERSYSNHYRKDYLRLHSSERDINFSKKIFSQFKNDLKQDDIKFYKNHDNLYSQLYKFFKLSTKLDLILGDGSDRIIKYCFESLSDKGCEVITTNPCFPMYEVYSKLYQTKLVTEKIKKPLFESDNLIKKINANTAFIIISNPLSPFGIYIELEEIEKIIVKALYFKTIVIIDEAYIEFSKKRSLLDIIKKKSYTNVVIIRTFSKAYGSAGIRAGVGISTKKIIARFKRFRTMHEISSFSHKWLMLLLKNKKEVKKYTKKVIENKDLIIKKFKDSNSIEIIDSSSNWIFVRRKQRPSKINFELNKIAVKENQIIPWEKYKDWYKLSIPYSYKSINKIISILLDK